MRIIIVIAVIAGIVFAVNKIMDKKNNDDGLKPTQTVTGMIEEIESDAMKGPRISTGNVVYITIDDGPSKYTDEMLAILKKYNAKATFFMIESNMRRYPEQVKHISESTSTAGFHSVTHDVKKLYASADAAKNEFDKCSKTYETITGKKSDVIRIPYGSKPYTPKASYDKMVAAGYKIWDWNVDTNDWKNTSSGIMDVVKTYGNGNNVVLLMHEKPQTLDAFDEMIKYYADRGYEFAAIGQDEKPKNFWLQNLSVD